MIFDARWQTSFAFIICLFLQSISAVAQPSCFPNASLGMSSSKFNSLYGNSSNHSTSHNQLKVLCDGGYAVVGTESNGTSNKIHLLRTDKNGLLQFSKTYTGSANIQATGLLYLENQGFLIWGADATNRPLLIKTDLTGTVQWAKSYDVLVNNVIERGCNKVIANANGFLFIVDLQAVNGVIQVDSNGVLISSKVFYTPTNLANFGFLDYYTDIIKTSDGGYAISAFNYQAEIGVIKTDQNLTPLWSRGYGDRGSCEEYPTKIIETSDGSFLISGYTKGYGNATCNNWPANQPGTPNGLILKINSSGIQQWARVYGNTQGENCDAIYKNDNGSYTFTGSSVSQGQNGAIYFSDIDASNGTISNTKLIDTPNEDGGQVIPTGNGGYILNAVTKVLGTGVYDHWLSKLDNSAVSTCLSPQSITFPNSSITLGTDSYATSSQNVSVTVTNPTITTSNNTISEKPNFTYFTPDVRDTTICPNTTALLWTRNAGAGANYTWSNGATTATIQVSPTVTSTYYVTVTTASGCTGKDSAIVTVQTNCSGLVAHYKLDGNPSDASGNNNNGIINGSVTATTDHLGNCEGAMQFGGYSNPGHISIPASSSLNFTNQQTISMWVKLNTFAGMDGNGASSPNGNHCIIGKAGDGIAVPPGFFISFYNSAGNLQIGYGVASPNSNISTSYPNYPLGTWFHLCIVVSAGNQMKSYINGNLTNTVNGPVNLSSSNTQRLTLGIMGSYGTPIWYPFNGALDDVRFYNRDLSTSEITQLYNEAEILQNNPLVSVTSTRANLCGSTPLTIKVNTTQTNSNFQWSKDGQVLTGQIGSTLQISQAGSYSVKVTSTSGCDTIITKVFRIDNSCRCQDSLALVDLYKNYGGTSWATAYRWNLDSSMTTWKGVHLNPQGCVFALDLNGDQYDFDYANLWTGNAPGIGITGSFPTPVCRLASLNYLMLDGNIGIRGAIADSIRYLTQLRYLYLHKTSVSGAFPEGFGELVNLEDITLHNTPLNTFIPSFIGKLRKLSSFIAHDAGLFGEIPSEMGSIDSLKRFDVTNNRLTKIPSTFSNPIFNEFLIGNNPIDSLSILRLRDYRWSGHPPVFWADNCSLTFDDLLPNLAQTTSRFNNKYAPQADFFTATTFNATIGNTVTIDLGIDKGIPDNNYRWFKNGVEVPSLFSQKNVFILRGVLPCDAGIYTCEVTNSRAPLLTLKSKPITINVSPIVPQTRNKTICVGQKDTLPSAQIVAPIASATYRETLRNQLNTCDSVIVTTNLTVTPLVVVSKIDSFCEGKTYTLTQRSTNNIVTLAGVYEDISTAANGCQTRYTTTLTYRSNLTRTERINLCTGEKYRLANDSLVNTTGVYTSRKPTSACDSVITTIVTVNQKPTAQIVGLTPFYCRDNTVVTLQGQPTGGTFRIDGATALNLNVSTLSAGNHTVSYLYRAANSCSDTATQTVRLGDLGRNTISRVICAGDSTTIRGKVYHQRNLTGTDVLTGAAASGCDSIITIQVSLHQKVKAIDDAVEVLINTGSVLIDVLQNDIYPANLYDIKMLQRPNIGTVEELNNDKFKLTIPNSVSSDIAFTYQLCHLNCVNDCTTATVRVKIKDKKDELDPIVTGITPNNDGKNDKFDLPQIDWSKYPESTLEIYNRWGQKLYFSAPYKRDWEGHDNNGQQLPNGDYFFILRLSLSDGKIVVGSVYLAK